MSESIGYILDDRLGMELALPKSCTQLGNAGHKTDTNTICQIVGLVERRMDRGPNKLWLLLATKERNAC